MLNQQQQQPGNNNNNNKAAQGSPKVETRVHLKGNPENGLNPETNPFYNDCYSTEQRELANNNNSSSPGSGSDGTASPMKDNSSETSPAMSVPRKNPFDTNRYSNSEYSGDASSAGGTGAGGGGGVGAAGNQSISPEIEQQRNTSISNDAQYKRNALAQLVVASLELLKSLPEDAAENLKVLLTPTIRSAFRLVAKNQNDYSYIE